MHRNLLLILCFLAIAHLPTASAYAQQPGWSNEAPVGFVFQISNNEAQKLLPKPKSDSIFGRLMHTQFDTFKIKRGWTRRPDRGHFIIARIKENEIHCEYAGILPYQVFLLREYNALTLQVIDKDGKVRGDAKVRLKYARIPFEPESHTYRMDDHTFYGDRTYVSVELDGFRSFFEVRKHERPYWAPSYYNDEGPAFYSYLVTDKNRYKPRQIVRFKSYALSQLRIPLQKKLDVWLIGNEKSIRMGQIEPHRPGSFASEFALHDSLNLMLDKYYRVELRDARHRTIASSNFKYEDYELNGDRLEVMLADAEQFYPSSNKLTITAKDVNGLPVAGARARIVVRPRTVLKMLQPLLYQPDTLYYAERELAFNAPTAVEIPAALFEKANLSYTVDVTLVNHSNQQPSKTAGAMFYYGQHALNAHLKGDSIIYEAMHNGKPMRGIRAELQYDKRNEQKEVTLPFQEKINTTVSRVTIKSPMLVRQIDMESLLPKIEILGGIENDSFKIAISNPHKVNVSWFVYRGSELLDKGFGYECSYQSPITDRSLSYYVELVFTFAGKERIIQREYRFNNKTLDVRILIPDRVYPGQSVDATISVTNQAGDPVGGVDLTAFGVTSKLNYYPTALPDYGTLSSQRETGEQFEKYNVDARNAVVWLDYHRWAKRAGLDTMKYYQLLYPDNHIFAHESPIKDSTQFSIYVMKNGQARKVFVVEVDHLPVYYSWTTKPSRYAHYVVPDKLHEVSLRLDDRVLTFDSLCFSQGYKTILSVDLDHLPGNVREQMIRQPSKRLVPGYRTFTDTERQRYSRYLACFKDAGRDAYLSSESRFTPIGDAAGTNTVAGPIAPGRLSLVDNQRTLNFKFVGGYTYVFDEDVVYREPAKDLIPDWLVGTFSKPSFTLNDLVLTKVEFLEHRKPEGAAPWITKNIEIVKRAHKLSISLPEDDNEVGVYSVLFEDPKSGKVTSACPLWNYYTYTDSNILPSGIFHLIVLYNDGSFFRMENIRFRSGLAVYVDFGENQRRAASDISAKWKRGALGNCFERAPSKVLTLPKSRGNLYGYSGNVQGTVYDETGNPLPGANVVIKGTTQGTVTDQDGNFSFDIANGYAEIVISFIGYVATEVELRTGTRVAVQMNADVTSLQEVVVIGYGTSTRREMTASVSALAGRVAGVQIDQLDESNLTAANDVIQNEDADQELYRELLALDGIRSNFTDVAFWEPRLFTNHQGIANFTVTFPDDITQWDAIVYAMNRRLQTGLMRTSIRSYKPIMAQLGVPRFMVTGDTAFVSGSLSNYSQDKTIQGSYHFESPGVAYDSAIVVEKFRPFMLPVVGVGGDSIQTKYVFKRDDGYTDGEVRSIPLIEQGTRRANGHLSMFSNGDRKIVSAGENENITVEVLGGPIDVFAGEAGYLIDYKYACNEQLASKLLGLIARRNIMRYEEKEFPYDQHIKNIIWRLLKNQNAEFFWSWWDVSSNTSYWVSAHILRALKAARDAGYSVDLDLNNIARKALYKFEMLESFSHHDADLLQALAEWEIALDYGRCVARVDTLMKRRARELMTNAHRNYSFLRERLLLMEVRQLTGLPYDRKQLLSYRQEGIRGEIYFSDGLAPHNWYGDDLTANTVAYRVVRRDSALRNMLVPMQLYFLSRRAQNEWNTYHSSSVLLSVLPDLLATGATKSNPGKVVVGGSALGLTGDFESKAIARLPYKVEVAPNKQLTLSKEGGIPMYVMEYKTEIVKEATSSGGAFGISTTLGDGSNVLVAGKVVKMVANITVMKDARAEYVMVEIPIPASCSYTDVRAPSRWNETHREYFKDRVNIYFEHMKAGSYRFEIELLPRFSGVYQVNPAQVSLMYVPVINANTTMTTTRVSVEQ